MIRVQSIDVGVCSITTCDSRANVDIVVPVSDDCMHTSYTMFLCQEHFEELLEKMVEFKVDQELIALAEERLNDNGEYVSGDEIFKEFLD